MKGRAVTDILTFDLGKAPLQWVSLASDLTEYPQISVTVPKPALIGTVEPGDSMEGWVAFGVDRNDSKPAWYLIRIQEALPGGAERCSLSSINDKLRGNLRTPSTNRSLQ